MISLLVPEYVPAYGKDTVVIKSPTLISPDMVVTLTLAIPVVFTSLPPPTRIMEADALSFITPYMEESKEFLQGK